jgi:hypothetical protein
VYQARKVRDLVQVIVPFMDEYLPASYKRQQYEDWRTRLLDHWEQTARRRRPCRVEGCDAPSKGQRLCRHHYWVFVERPRRAGA